MTARAHCRKCGRPGTLYQDLCVYCYDGETLKPGPRSTLKRHILGDKYPWGRKRTGEFRKCFNCGITIYIIAAKLKTDPKCPRYCKACYRKLYAHRQFGHNTVLRDGTK